MKRDTRKADKFAVYAEAEKHDRPLVLTHLSFAQLIDDVVVPYEKGEAFFIDGASVTKKSLRRIKVIRQIGGFNADLTSLHVIIRGGDVKRQKLYAEQYHIRLEAILRECGQDVTAQVIKAFNAEIKPSLKDYLPKRDELIPAALEVFVNSMKALTGPG